MLSPKVLSPHSAAPKKRLKLALSDQLFGGVVNVKTAFQFVAHCWLIQPNRILGFYQGFLVRKKHQMSIFFLSQHKSIYLSWNPESAL